MITLQKCGACNGTNVVTESSKIGSLTQNLKRICGKCINGLLEVDVLLEDGSVKSRVINHSPVTLSAQQIEESRTRLSALKIYPRDMLINRTFKAKLEELWARALGDEREEIGRVITDFDAALQSNDMARVDEVRRRASVYLAIETS